jgi:hypothetical protein
VTPQFLCHFAQGNKATFENLCNKIQAKVFEIATEAEGKISHEIPRLI